MTASACLPRMKAVMVLMIGCSNVLAVAGGDAESCFDSPIAVDQFGQPCSVWKGYDCTRAETWGYTTQGKEYVLANCRKSCDKCGPDPTPSPTPMPTPTPPPPTVINASAVGGCVDMPGFIDELGGSCDLWKGYNCSRGAIWGYSAQGIAALLSGCKVACDQCQPPTPSPTPSTPAPTPLPTPAQTFDGACEDVLGYADEFGSPCSVWVGYDCYVATIWGYTQAGKESLLASCGETCGRCTEAPTPVPTPWPTSVSATPLPTSADGSEQCGDVLGFVDELGAACKAWAGYDCGNARNWGYSEEATVSILANCRKSCDECKPETPAPTTIPTPPPTTTRAATTTAPTTTTTSMVATTVATTMIASTTTRATECRDDATFTDENGFTCAAWSGYECTMALTWGFPQESVDVLLASCQVACGVCRPEASAPCSDVAGFLDEYGVSCSAWVGSDCATAEVFMYSQLGEDALIANCKESCGLCHRRLVDAGKTPFRLVESILV